MSGGYDKESMMNQAQHVWTMLDDMANNDPKAYKAFIDKQMAERKEFMSPAQPHMCLHTTMVKPEKVPFYINFCSWKRIPAPGNNEEPVKVAGSAIGHVKDEKGKAAVTAVAFNEKVLEEYGKDARNKTDQDILIQIAMDFIEKQHSNICLNRQYKILEKSHIGSIKLIQESLFQAFASKEQDFNENIDSVIKDFAPLATESPESLLDQLNKSDTDPRNYAKNNAQIGDKISGIKLNTQPVKKGLIEEVSSEITPKNLPEPKYDLNRNNDMLVLKINLPEVMSVSECELDISKEDIYLCVEDKYELKLTLPITIQDDIATAKFIKKSHVLHLSMPITPQ